MSGRGRRSRTRRVVAAVAVVSACAPLSACKEVEEQASERYSPAKVEPIEGSRDLQRVTFTDEGARRVGLRTGRVRRSGTRDVVPYAALIYDAEGRTFVYRTTGRLTFVRERVGVARVDGSEAVLSRGPAPGTSVVTVGAAEVYGTELDVGH